MKINKLILKILFLYFFIYLMLFLSGSLLMPLNLEKSIFIIFLNIFPTAFLLCVSMSFIYKNIKNSQKYILPLHFNEVLGNNKKRNTNTYMNKIIYYNNVIYFICKNVPFILYFLGLIIPILVATIFKGKNIFIICLLSAFSSVVFYIFSRRLS